MNQKERILQLCDDVRDIAGSGQNDAAMRRWQPAAEDVSVTQGASVWHGVPCVPLSSDSVVPYTLDPELGFWSELIGFDLAQYYQDPLCYLENYLKIKIERYRLFQDDSYVTKEVSIFIGVNLEPSMFGVPSIYQPGRDPANDPRAPVVRSEEDIDRLKAPDFYASGIMPKTHRFYQKMRDILPDDFSVVFPIWGRGPWGVAQHLMGFESLMLTVLDNPQMIHRLMKFIVECQCKWLSERASFLGIPLGVGVMYNDEVNAQLLSPAMYEEFIFPYEAAVADYQNGISYWHSCGDSGPLLPYIKQLKGLQMHDVSAWTDWDTAVKQLQDTGIALEVRMHPVRDVLLADEGQMRAKLAHLRERFDGLPVTVRADGMNVVNTMKRDMDQIRRWCKLADEMLHLTA